MKVDFSNVQTLVVKIGTALLSSSGGIDASILNSLVRDMAQLKREKGFNLLLVSSGAIGFGMDLLGMKSRPAVLPMKQATAAVGQARLMHTYETLFMKHGNGLKTAQVLLSIRDLDDRQSYLNIRNTINTLFEFKDVIPIVNENDSTATQELKFGDNDTLSARIASKVGADLLILLSDIDGLYDANPSRNQNSKLIPLIENITEQVLSFAEDTSAQSSTGGMKTKLEAAKITNSSGIPMIIANGRKDGIISSIFRGDALMTVFSSPDSVLPSRKRWIAFGSSIRGRIVIDAGAREALLNRGKSLLPAGILEVEGRFEQGEAVSVLDPELKEIARGLVNYSSGQMKKILGVQTHEIAAYLGRKDYDCAIHRDNMVIV